MTKQVKKMSDKYFAKTPVFYTKLGDGLLSVSTMVTGFAIYEEYKWLAFTALILGSAGKFITNFFSDEDGDGVIDVEQRVVKKTEDEIK